jgi:histone H3/H4
MKYKTINKIKVKELIKERGFNTSGQLYNTIMEDIDLKLKKACERALQNGRKTVYSKDY